MKSSSSINGSMKQRLSSQDLLFLLLTKQKLFSFAKLPLPGFEMFHSSKISILPSGFLICRTLWPMYEKTSYPGHEVLFRMQTRT